MRRIFNSNRMVRTELCGTYFVHVHPFLVLIISITANSENLVSARAQKIKKPGHSKKEMASIKGKRKADASCS